MRMVVTEFAFVAAAGAAVVGCGRVTVLPAGGTGPVVLNVPAIIVRCVEVAAGPFNLRQRLVLALLDVLHQVDSEVEEPHSMVLDALLERRIKRRGEAPSVVEGKAKCSASTIEPRGTASSGERAIWTSNGASAQSRHRFLNIDTDPGAEATARGNN